MNLHSRIEVIKPFEVAFIRRIGTYGSGNHETMSALKSFAAANGLMTKEAVILGIAQDNPMTTPPEKCRYDACVSVNDGFSTDNANVQVGTFGGGKYMVFTVPHTAEAVAEVWGVIYPQTVAAGENPDFTKPVIERYTIGGVEAGVCEICVPIE